jgi:hypothetical protein
MVKSTTTHVIEIDAGIGEPAFIPLSMGQELQPISVGKRGMWRIESPRVLDVHAFLYFDGRSLFLQSADEANAASVDGHRVSKAWTELHAPCTIDVGAARLRFRSLIADDQPTMMTSAAPLKGSPGASMPAAAAPPPPSSQRNLGGQWQAPSTERMHGSQRPTGQAPAAAGSQPAVASPRSERPFRPGAFSSQPEIGDSTRVAPLDSTGSHRSGVITQPRPAAGQPATEELTRAERGSSGGSGGSGAPPPVQDRQGGQPQGPSTAPGMGYAQQQPQQGYAPQEGYTLQGAYPNPAGFNPAHAAMPQIPGPPGFPQGAFGPGQPPAGYGAMPPPGGMQQQLAQAPEGFVAKLKANSIPKMIALLLFVISGALYLAEEQEPAVRPKKKVVATVDGGSADTKIAAGGSGSAASANPSASASASAKAAASSAPPTVASSHAAPAWPPGVPCPPPNWPADTPLPCTPNAAGKLPDKAATAKDPKDAGKIEPRDAGAPLAPGAKTLERQAVDFLVSGNTAKAAAAYDELARRDPSNKVYAEAARILRAKQDGSLPRP